MAIDIASSIIDEHSHIHALELELERTQKQYSLTCEQETSRRIRLDLLLLQEENVDLQTQLLEKEERVDLLEEDLEEQSAALEQLNLSMSNLQVELRTKLREADRLKAEVNTLQALSQDAAILLEEKLALSRELSNIKPELEHLKAQQAENSNILSEKLALQRELQSLHVELDNEKRAVQKALSRNEGQSTRELHLEAELKELKSNLAKEKSLRDKTERENQKASGSFEAQNAALESRLEDYRAKLKSAKEQIKTTRAELDEARKANDRLQQEKQRVAPANRGKRNYSQVEADATIGTPDGFPPKRLNRGSALLGERSEFPITPFLNPTTRLNIETPVDEPEDREDGAQDEEEDQDQEETVLAKPVMPAPALVATKVKKAVAPRPAPKLKPKQVKPVKPVPKKLEQLEEVPEDDEEEEEEEEVKGSSKPAVIVPAVAAKAPTKAVVPKKKRRVLGAGPGKTLFDDDDHITGKIDSRGGLDDFKFAMPKRVTLAPKGATALAAKGKGNALSGFAAFSPLKKDRKAAK